MLADDVWILWLFSYRFLLIFTSSYSRKCFMNFFKKGKDFEEISSIPSSQVTLILTIYERQQSMLKRFSFTIHKYFLSPASSFNLFNLAHTSITNRVVCLSYFCCFICQLQHPLSLFLGQILAGFNSQSLGC